jgi:hypothetical protein
MTEPIKQDCLHPHWFVERADDGRVINKCVDCSYVVYVEPENEALFRGEPDVPREEESTGEAGP